MGYWHCCCDTPLDTGVAVAIIPWDTGVGVAILPWDTGVGVAILSRDTGVSFAILSWDNGVGVAILLSVNQCLLTFLTQFVNYKMLRSSHFGIVYCDFVKRETHQCTQRYGPTRAPQWIRCCWPSQLTNTSIDWASMRFTT